MEVVQRTRGKLFRQHKIIHELLPDSYWKLFPGPRVFVVAHIGHTSDTITIRGCKTVDIMERQAKPLEGNK